MSRGRRSSRDRRFAAAFLLALPVAAGIVLRLAFYLGRHSLTLDEASLALNVAARDWRGLLEPLDYAQMAPVAFLWATRAIASVVGFDELGLRALAFVGGCAALVVFAPLARRVLAPRAALLAVSLAAASPLLVSYSNEFKPYVLGVLASSIVLLCTVPLVERSQGRGSWTALVLAGVFGILVDAPFPLVLASVLGAIVLADVTAGRAVPWRAVTLATCIWLGLFVGLHATINDAPATRAYMYRFWDPAFVAPWKPGFAVAAQDRARSVLGAIFVGMGSNPRGFIVLGTIALLVVGLVSIGHAMGPGMVALLAGPLLGLCVASALQVFPMESRLVVFAVPHLVLLAGAGIGAVLDRVPGRVRGLAGVLAAAVVLGPALANDRAMVFPAAVPEHSRPLVERAEASRGAGEPIYVGARALPAWVFYTTDWRAFDGAGLAWLARVAGVDGPAFSNAPTRGRYVEREGDDLVYEDRGRQVLVGIADGQQWRPVTQLEPASPDPGWADNEARRIRAAAAPTALVFLAHTFAPGLKALQEALLRAGGVVVEAHDMPFALLRRYRFDRVPSRAGDS